MPAIAWGGAALFLASLAYFAYFYLVLLGRPAVVPVDAAPRAVATNVALFTIFALHHSFFARLGLKARVTRGVGPGLERSLYVWLASLLFLAVCLLWRPLSGEAWRATGIARWLLHAAQLAGLVLTLKSASRIDIWELAGIRQARAARPSTPVATQTSGSVEAPGPALSVPSVPAVATQSSVASAASVATVGVADLEIGGPYRWLRHPIYLGWILFVFGAPEMTAGRLLFAAVSTLYLIVAIPFEERSLTSEFGPAYREYQRRVRWRLVPGVW